MDAGKGLEEGDCEVGSSGKRDGVESGKGEGEGEGEGATGGVTGEECGDEREDANGALLLADFLSQNGFGICTSH